MALFADQIMDNDHPKLPNTQNQKSFLLDSILSSVNIITIYNKIKAQINLNSPTLGYPATPANVGNQPATLNVNTKAILNARILPNIFLRVELKEK